MSRETAEWLNTQTLIGYTEKRGTAWHYRKQMQGTEPNHYTGAIPVEAVRRRLFNWTAKSAAVMLPVELDDGRRFLSPAPNHGGIYRSDTGAPLGINSTRYVAHDYDEWLIRNVESILDADLQIGSAGLLKGGARAWVQVEMEDTLNVEGVDFRPFLTAATSLDGSLTTTYLTGAQLVVCDNTLSAALGDKSHQVRVRHSSKSLGRLADVREALSIVHSVADSFAAEVQRLTSERVSDAEWSHFVELYTAPGNDPAALIDSRSRNNAYRKAELLHQLWSTDHRAAPWTGTAYGALAAVNTYAHHYQSIRGSDRHTRNTERVISGKVDNLDTATLHLLTRATGRDLLPA